MLTAGEAKIKTSSLWEWSLNDYFVTTATSRGFNVTGRSSLPADVFLDLKAGQKQEEIVLQSGYIEIFRECGTVFHPGQDKCAVYDWMTAINNVFLKPRRWHFQFKPCKRIFL